MNHKVKTGIFKLLGMLPDGIGFRLYHYLQHFSENSDLDFKISSTEITFTTFQDICNKVNIDIENKPVLEIGSGWLPIIPYLLLYKAKSGDVHTYDLNTHYQKASVLQLNDLFSEKYHLPIVPEKGNKFGLPKGIHYHPAENLINAEMPDVKVVFSRFVLEHVTKNDIIAMHKKFKETLAKDTYIIHFISPSDHRAYSDATLSLQDFLQYSEAEWNQIQTKFDYHNRLRLPQYLEIFTDLGYEIAYLFNDKIKSGTPQYELFQKLRIHPDFSGYSEEELTAGSINIVLKL